MEPLQSWVVCDLNAAHPYTQWERINDSICWALVIPSANESSPERHDTGPLGSLKLGISRVYYKLGWQVHWTATPAPPKHTALPHQLPPGCLFSVTQLGWILLKIWCSVRTQRCLERLPLIINTTAGNDVVEKKKSPWSSTHSLWCLCIEFTAQRKRYSFFKIIIIKKSGLTFSNHNHMTQFHAFKKTHKTHTHTLVHTPCILFWVTQGRSIWQW